MAEDDSRPSGVGDDPGQRPDWSDPGRGWSDPGRGAGPDYHYYGPYDESGRDASGGGAAPDPLGIGAWAAEKHTQPIPPAGPSYASHAGYGYPAPGVPPLPPQGPARAASSYPPPARRTSRGGVGPAAVIAIAAIAALVVGGSAGYAGSRLAERAAPGAVSSTLGPANPQPSDPAPAGPNTPRPSASKPSTSKPSALRTPVGPAPEALNAVEVAAATLPGTVMIRVGSGSDGSIGSGFVLDDSGLVMTNNHVVADAAGGARLRVVFSDGTQASASLVGRSPTYDIAVIRVKTSHALVPLAIGNSDDTRVGESVLAIGSPLGLPGTVTQGIVSARNRPVAVGSEGQASNAYLNGTQTDASINPGNSGGPLVDAGGRVIGVNSAILTLGGDRQQAGNIGLGFAIPINQAIEIGKLLIADGKATYPVIGADVANSGDLAGVRLKSVNVNGPADRAGLREGDVITEIDGQNVTVSEELIVAVRSLRPGDQVTLSYRRNGQVREARVTLGSREG